MIEDEKIKAENEKKRKELAQAYKRFSMTKDGKVILKDVRNFCGQDRPSFCEQSPNALQTHINEGKRRVWLRIDRMINREDEK